MELEDLRDGLAWWERWVRQSKTYTETVEGRREGRAMISVCRSLLSGEHDAWLRSVCEDHDIPQDDAVDPTELSHCLAIYVVKRLAADTPA